MKHNWIAALSIAAAFAVSAHAQTTTTPQPDQKDQKPAAAKITLTGCVERADQVASAGTTATTVDSQSFMLINASKDGAASKSETVGTSGTAPAATKDAKGETYKLDAEAAKLNPHVGHKVEVTGVVDSSASAPAASDAPSRDSAPRIKVETVKMLAETCAR